jgi:hypothetical protein
MQDYNMNHHLDYEQLESFEQLLSKKKFVNLKYKTSLLKIRYLVDMDNIDKALAVLTKLENNPSLKHNLIFQMEIMFLESLIFSRDFEFQTAKIKLNNLTEILDEYNLEYYRKRQQEVLQMINEHSTIYHQIYEFADEKTKETTQTQQAQISLDVVHEYLEQAMKIIT